MSTATDPTLHDVSPAPERGERLKDVCGEVSRATGLSRKALYDAVVARPSAG